MASSRRTGTNEVVSTGGNATRDYDLTAGEHTAWESASQSGPGANNSPVLECYDDAASYTWSARFDIAGAASDATYFRIIRAESGSRNGGIPGVGINFTMSVDTSMFLSSEAYFSLQDVNLSWTATSSSNRNIILLSTGANQDVVGVIVYDCINTSSGLMRIIVGNIGGVKIRNCLVTNCDNTNNSAIAFHQFTTGDMEVDNCTATKVNIGYRNEDASQAFVRKNCIADGCTDLLADFGGGGFTDTTCYEGTQTLGTYSLTYANSAGGDFHLTDADVVTIGNSTDLSADFDDDIDFDARPASTSFGVGFDYHAVAAAGVPPWVLKPQIQGAGVL